MTEDATRDPTSLTSGGPEADRRLARIRFRAWRRGFREADLVLGGFVDAHGASLSADDLDRLEALLEEPDHAVFAWIVGREPPPARHDHALLRRIQAHCGGGSA